MATLLGYLAQFGSFYTQGEVLCTQGLAYLLQDPAAQSAFAAKITNLIDVNVGSHLTWRAEAHQDDRGRPDLEARDIDGSIPSVKIEAKLGAALSEGQLRSYVRDLHDRSPEGVLLALVPRHRTKEATAVAAKAFSLSGSGPLPPTEDRDVTWTRCPRHGARLVPTCSSVPVGALAGERGAASPPGAAPPPPALTWSRRRGGSWLG